MHKKGYIGLVTLVVLSLLLTACGGNEAAPTATTGATQPTAAATAAETATTSTAADTPTTVAAAETPTEALTAAETPTTGGGIAAATDFSKVGQELADAYTGKYKGTKVTMFGPFGSEDEVKFNNAVKPFEDATGIDIQYEGSKEFETTINVRVEGGNPPDIADLPQPGLMASIAKSGKVLDASKFVNPEWLKQNYNQGYIDTATVDGPNGKILGGVFHRVNAKSIVWYPKKAFDEAGYKIPQTWDEQTALMDQIVKDGDTPWCIGIESGTATGWPATDWMEDIMLRTTSLENYDKWVKGDLPFTSPEVKKAAQVMSDIWLNDKYVYGGRKQIVSTAFGDAPAPMFQDPPKCYLHRQGNFITSFFEKVKPGVKAGVDYDFYYLPPIDPQYGKPVLFAGDVMVAFNDRPEVRAVEEYFSTYESVKGWVAAGGAISPHKNSNLADYSTDTDRKLAQLILNATSVRFDASDLMPGAVGAGTFWKGMTDYVSGSVNLDQAMDEIQKGWASVKK
ncbi:MAG: ABC transporter substrate-binding protein [Chloroflexota bacterium]|nr:ABC transporter substrate-binding protein [Chloroflexota bacterium]